LTPLQHLPMLRGKSQYAARFYCNMRRPDWLWWAGKKRSFRPGR